MTPFSSHPTDSSLCQSLPHHRSGNEVHPIAPSYSSAVAQFLDYLESVKNASNHTVRGYRADFDRFLHFLIEKEEQRQGKLVSTPQSGSLTCLLIASETKSPFDCPLEKIDHPLLRSFTGWQVERGVHRRSAIRALSALRSLFRFALREGWIETNPAALLRAPRCNKPLPTPLTYPEVERLLGAANPESFLGLRDRTILELFYSSGLRLSELVGVNLSDLFLQEQLIQVRGKGRKERLLPITRAAAEWIARYLQAPERKPAKGCSALFLNCFGKRLTTRSVDRLFKTYLEKSGLQGTITPHTIRHTIATHWLENGMNIKFIQELLGHSSPATTTIYASVSARLKQDTYARAHPHAGNRAPKQSAPDL